MLKSLGVSIIICTSFLQASAQKIEAAINNYSENFAAEKVHLHFDKEVYLPGETVWFKAYVFEENLPSLRSTNFYISLYNKNGTALQQKIYPIINATADGHFDIADTTTSDQLICRAYTSWMLNFDTAFLFTKAIKIFTGNAATDTIKKSTAVSLRFFAEGGDMIEGERNTVAFKATYNNGLPFQVNGIIKKQPTGEEVATLKTQHDGMGKFDIEQQPGEKYFAEWTDNNGKLQQTQLPEKKLTGVAFKVVQQKTKLYYNVVNKSATDTLHVLAYMYQKIIYKASLPIASGERHTGVIPLESFPSGALQLTVFNAAWQPVAERICFINNNNFLLNTTVNATAINLQKRGKNSIEISMADTVPANLSLSVTDADFNSEASGTSIISNLLLSGDIKGYINNPAYYFTKPGDALLQEQLDLVMLTHGWRRYNWDNMLAQKMPVINFAPDNYLSLYGQISNDALYKIKKEETVNLIVKTKDSTTHYYFAKPDEKGFLKTGGLIFYDTAKIYFSFNTEKLFNKQLAFSNSNLTLAQGAAINNYHDYFYKEYNGVNANPALTSFYTAFKNNLFVTKEKTLQGVVVKSGGWRNWKNDPIVKMDEKYSSGMFSGGATGYAFDLVHDEKAWTKLDIYNYIRNNIPGLVIGNFNIANGRPLFYRERKVIIYIDEHEMQDSDLENLSIAQVAFIKLLPNFMGRGADAGGSSITPALSVYTRKGNDLIDRSPKQSDLGMVKVAGYSSVKEFYAPAYSSSSKVTGNDARTTLLWLPYIFTDKNNLKIPITFYNNDISKRIKIIVEGINDEGKLIHLEKIIE